MLPILPKLKEKYPQIVEVENIFDYTSATPHNTLVGYIPYKEGKIEIHFLIDGIFISYTEKGYVERILNIFEYKSNIYYSPWLGDPFLEKKGNDIFRIGDSLCDTIKEILALNSVKFISEMGK